MQRKDVYRRDQSLHRIQAETERAYDLIGQQEALRVQRKMANMNASFQRERLMEVGLPAFRVFWGFWAIGFVRSQGFLGTLMTRVFHPLSIYRHALLFTLTRGTA